MIPESLYRWAQLKGIAVVGTGDVTHPAWFAELQENLYRQSRAFIASSQNWPHL